MDELKMSIDEMISTLDGACGRLIVASMSDPVVREAHQMVMKVSLALGELGQEEEEHLSGLELAEIATAMKALQKQTDGLATECDKRLTLNMRLISTLAAKDKEIALLRDRIAILEGRVPRRAEYLCSHTGPQQ